MPGTDTLGDDAFTDPSDLVGVGLFVRGPDRVRDHHLDADVVLCADDRDNVQAMMRIAQPVEKAVDRSKGYSKRRPAQPMPAAQTAGRPLRQNRQMQTPFGAARTSPRMWSLNSATTSIRAERARNRIRVPLFSARPTAANVWCDGVRHPARRSEYPREKASRWRMKPFRPRSGPIRSNSRRGGCMRGARADALSASPFATAPTKGRASSRTASGRRRPAPLTSAGARIPTNHRSAMGRTTFFDDLTRRYRGRHLRRGASP
jgi:hypothetical protein